MRRTSAIHILGRKGCDADLIDFYCRCDFCSGQTRSLGWSLADVRVTPDSGHRADIGGRLKCAITGREQMR
jgi:hypothetical protein